jgi:cytochrome c2
MRSRGWTGLAAVVVVIAVGGGVWANHIEATRRAQDHAHALTGGDPQAGRAAIARRPCGGCHEIPGVPGAHGKVGPPLTGLAGRSYIAGRLSNTPENLAAWIVDPHAIDPLNAMPPTGVTPHEARDIAAYLYSVGS